VAPRRKKQRLSVQDQVEPMIKDATEQECWYLAMRFLQGAKEKVRATPPNRVEELQGYQLAVKKLAESVYWPPAMHPAHPGSYPGEEPRHSFWWRALCRRPRVCTPCCSPAVGHAVSVHHGMTHKAPSVSNRRSRQRGSS
jgi:hypothetical protein